jgi:hypothetical protein
MGNLDLTDLPFLTRNDRNGVLTYMHGPPLLPYLSLLESEDGVMGGTTSTWRMYPFAV